MNTTSSRRKTSERGAILVHVATGIVAFLAFNALALDYGIKWASRGEAQNSADAGALAGAYALITNDSQDDDGLAKRTAQAFATANAVWGEVPDVDIATDVTFPPCPDSVGVTCIRVDVYRNQERSNPLPMYFGQFVGVDEQGVRATATAEVGSGTTVKCLLPWAVADRWGDFFDENVDETFFPNDGDGNGGVFPDDLEAGKSGWSMNDRYQAASGDVYRSPVEYTDGSHTGWTTDPVAEGGDKGRQLILKWGAVGNFSSGWAGKIDLVGSTGGSDYQADIEGCNENPISIALPGELCDEPFVENSRTTEQAALIGCVSASTGVTQGPTRHGVENFIADHDGDGRNLHHWDDEEGSIVDGAGNPVNSPRTRPLIVFDINHYMSQGCSGTGCTTRVANIIGFFVEGMCNTVTLDPGMNCDDPNKDVVGRIIELPGEFLSGAGNVSSDASFLNFVRLVR
ncbi:MAG: pilus assembly protein TadG-related protein [Vicinamibacterales bacterium]